MSHTGLTNYMGRGVPGLQEHLFSAFAQLGFYESSGGGFSDMKRYLWDCPTNDHSVWKSKMEQVLNVFEQQGFKLVVVNGVSKNFWYNVVTDTQIKLTQGKMPLTDERFFMVLNVLERCIERLS